MKRGVAFYPYLILGMKYLNPNQNYPLPYQTQFEPKPQNS